MRRLLVVRDQAVAGARGRLFDVAFDNGTDLWSVPVTCTACEFPAGVRRVTSDGMSRDPAWTPGTVRSFSAVAKRARGALALRVTLSRRATVRIAGVQRGGHRVTVRVPGEPALRLTARVR